MTAQSDTELLNQMAGGDEAAFTTLYRSHQGSIYRYALRLSGSPSVAADVTQEVFLTLIRNSAGYRQADGPLAAYLLGIARNLLLRAVGKDRPLVSLEQMSQQENPVTGALIAPGDCLAKLTRDERVESVRRAVATLPLHYREILVLCDLEAMTYAEAAEIVGCTPGTVRSRLHRARGLLHEKLSAAGRRPARIAKSNPERCPA